MYIYIGVGRIFKRGIQPQTNVLSEKFFQMGAKKKKSSLGICFSY